MDDTPFTACTPESVALQRARDLAAAQGRSLPPGTVTAIAVNAPALPAAAPATAQPAPPVTVSTKTYRGKPGLLRDGRRRLSK